MSIGIKTNLSKHFKKIELEIKEDELNNLMNIERINMLDLELLSKVIKYVKTIDNSHISRKLVELKMNMKRNNDLIDEFIDEVEYLLIDRELLLEKLDNFDRSSTIDKTVLYTNALKGIENAELFKDKGNLYLEDVIRYTKLYIKFAYNYTTMS
uniref:Uncharacterized protein n=1 Tax=Pithovirus LCPAC403 TaxID=2506596 RepID=A0A481ZB22_9VIRU|nr:MAG: uncharacterized protein LCPAC403_02580 [Pithovirus LCPAC403]